MANLQANLERFNVLNVLNPAGTEYVSGWVGSETLVTEAVHMRFSLRAGRLTVGDHDPCQKTQPLASTHCYYYFKCKYEVAPEILSLLSTKKTPKQRFSYLFQKIKLITLPQQHHCVRVGGKFCQSFIKTSENPVYCFFCGLPD